MWKHVEKTVDVISTGKGVYEVRQKKNVEHILTEGSAVSAAMRLKLRPARFKVGDVEYEREYDEWTTTGRDMPYGNHWLKDQWFWDTYDTPLVLLWLCATVMLIWNPIIILPDGMGTIAVWWETLTVWSALTALFAVLGYRRYRVNQLNQREKHAREAHRSNEPEPPDNPTKTGLMMEVTCEKKINADWMSMSRVLKLENWRNRSRDTNPDKSSLVALITGLIEVSDKMWKNSTPRLSEPTTILERKYVLEINQFIEDPSKWETLVVNTRETLNSIMRESLAGICAESSTKDDVAARITSKITDDLFGGLPDLLEKKRKEREVLSVERRLSGL